MLRTIIVTLEYTVERARTMENSRNPRFLADLRADAAALRIPTPRYDSVRCVGEVGVQFYWIGMSESAVCALPSPILRKD